MNRTHSILYYVCAILALTACDGTADIDAGGADSGARGDAGGPIDDAGQDAGGDASHDGGAAGPTIVAAFDGAAFELPESLALHAGAAYLSFLSGAVVRVTAEGAVESFGSVPIEPAGSAYALGVAVDGGGNVFVAMAKASATSAFPSGVYRIPAAGGEGTLFATHASLYIPNDLDVSADGLLYITADGAIFRASATAAGDAELWVEDALLASSDGSATAPCGARTSPFPIGANGIETESSRVIAGNTETGSLVAIPIEADGSAGAPATLTSSTASLCGIDGLVGDGGGAFIASALGRRVVRVEGATVTVLHEGLPLRTPSGVDVGIFGASRQVLVSNPDFEHAFGSGGPASAAPNLVAIPL